MSTSKKSTPKSSRKPKRLVRITELDLARALAASYLVSPVPQTQGDIERFWEERGEADRKAHARRAAQIFRMLTLPEGEAGHYMMPHARRTGT